VCVAESGATLQTGMCQIIEFTLVSPAIVSNEPFGNTRFKLRPRVKLFLSLAMPVVTVHDP